MPPVAPNNHRTWSHWRATAARLGLVVATAAALGGCSSAPEIAQSAPVRAADLARFTAFSVVVDGTAKVKALEEFPSVALDLRDKLSTNLQAAGLSAFPGEGATEGVLAIRLLVTDLNYVNSTARAFVGLWAGKAVLNLTMNLSDRRDGSSIGEVTSASSSRQSADTHTQVRLTAEHLSAQITGKTAR